MSEQRRCDHAGDCGAIGQQESAMPLRFRAQAEASLATRSSEGFSDGLTGHEGTFSRCSFWYVECLSRMGELANHQPGMMTQVPGGLPRPVRPILVSRSGPSGRRIRHLAQSRAA